MLVINTINKKKFYPTLKKKKEKIKRKKRKTISKLPKITLMFQTLSEEVKLYKLKFQLEECGENIYNKFQLVKN